MPRFLSSLCLLAALTLASSAIAGPSTRPVERRIAIGDGRVPVQSLLDTIGVDAGLDRASMPWMNVDLSNGRCATFCRDLAQALGEGCSAKVVDGTICVSI